MKILKYYIGWWFWKYGYYSLFSIEFFAKIVMANNYNMKTFYKPTWFRLLEDFFIFLIYIRLLAQIELYMFMIIRFIILTLLIINKLFLFVAILLLINIGGRILYNFSYSNTNIEYIKQEYFYTLTGRDFAFNNDYQQDLHNITPNYIKPTWHNATFMYLAFTLDRIPLRYTDDDACNIFAFDMSYDSDREIWDEYDVFRKRNAEIKFLVQPDLLDEYESALKYAIFRKKKYVIIDLFKRIV